MEYPNFLMNVYFGDLDQTPLQQYEGLVDDEKTKDIIAQFLDLSRQYPARSIEDAGRVPEELLDKLKAIKFFGLNIAAPYGGLGLSLRQYLKVAEVVATNNMDLGFTALAHLSIGAKGLVEQRWKAADLQSKLEIIRFAGGLDIEEGLRPIMLGLKNYIRSVRQEAKKAFEKLSRQAVLSPGNNQEILVGVGADWLVRRDFSVGFELRYALLVPDAKRYPLA